MHVHGLHSSSHKHSSDADGLFSLSHIWSIFPCVWLFTACTWLFDMALCFYLACLTTMLHQDAASTAMACHEVLQVPPFAPASHTRQVLFTSAHWWNAPGRAPGATIQVALERTL